MRLTHVKNIPANGVSVEAFLPFHLAEVYFPNAPPEIFNTTSLEFERACHVSNSGQLALLKGSYKVLLEDAFLDAKGSLRRLRSMLHTPRRVAILCNAEQVVDLEHAPPIIGADILSIVPPDHYDGYYLLSLSRFADLRLRYFYSSRGIKVPLLPEPLIVDLGVFLPQLTLVRAFLQLTSTLRRQGVDDFSNQVVSDTFSGSGVFGFLAGYLGARSVHFIDIDPLANECVSVNINRYRPHFWTAVHTADVFPEGLVANTIIANPPWKDVRRGQELPHHFIDPGRTILKRFFNDLRSHLVPGGVVYLFYERAGKQDVFEGAENFSTTEYPVTTLSAPCSIFRLRSL